MDAAAALRESVERIPAIDQHAHLLSAPSAARPGLTDLLTESTEPEQAAQMREHPVYLRAVRDLAALLECDPTEEAVASTRDRLGVDAYDRRLMEACRFEAMLVDDGFPVPNAASFDEHAALAGCPVRRVIRVESIAEAAASGTPAPPFDAARERFRAMIEGGLREGAVGLKTIAAYRSGLDLPADVSTDDGRMAYERWLGPTSDGLEERASRRLTDPALISLFLLDALRAASEVRPVPLQVHTGFGDHDLTMPKADPSWFRWYFECGLAGTEAPVVFLHCYPFVREASWLAHVYGRAHVDLSFALTFAGHRGADLVSQALEVAPATKLLFATDGSRQPELFVLGTTWWREALAGALGRLVAERSIDEGTARRWAEMILRGNAARIYGDVVPGKA